VADFGIKLVKSVFGYNRYAVVLNMFIVCERCSWMDQRVCIDWRSENIENLNNKGELAVILLCTWWRKSCKRISQQTVYTSTF